MLSQFAKEQLLSLQIILEAPFVVVGPLLNYCTNPWHWSKIIQDGTRLGFTMLHLWEFVQEKPQDGRFTDKKYSVIAKHVLV
jgi:hypothetical protein